MKYFIQVWMVLLFTFSVHATNQYAEDVIIPEYFSSTVKENTSVINNEIATNIHSTDDIIVPESFKKNKETSISNEINVISEEPITQTNTSAIDIIDNDTDIPNQNYTGHYNLLKGSTSLGGSFQQLDYGFLVIEELDENDFGFYYVIQKGDNAPTNRYGILHYKDGRFFQKFLDGSPLRDNVNLLKSGMELSTKSSGNLGDYDIQWIEGSAEDINSLSPRLQTYLKDSKESYKQIYKDNFKN